jgi:hypothetical protein
VKQVKDHALFFVILLVCAVLRFIPLFEYQFTLDELSGLCRTEFDSFGELMDKGVKIDAHPALIQVLIYYLSAWFGYHNWIIKLPFLLMSLGTVVYAYRFSSHNFSKQAGIFSALVFSFSLVFVFYAPIARMYCSGVFFSTALLYYFFEILFLKQSKVSNYVFFGLFAVLSALNQHLNALFALTVCGSGLLFLNRANAKAYLLTCLAVVVLYLPHLPVTLYQLDIGGIDLEQNGWLPKPDLFTVFKFTKIVLGTGKSWYVFMLLIMLVGILRKGPQIHRRQWLLLVLFFLNYAIIYLYSVNRASVYQHSVMLFSGVALVLFITSFLDFRNRYVFGSLALLLASVLIYKTYFKKDYLHQAVKTVFEYQFERTAHYKKLYGDKAVYPIFFDADSFMQKIYFAKYGHFEGKISSDSLVHSMTHFSRFVATLNCDYVVLTSATPAYQAVAKQYFPYLLENTQTQAINYKLYSKRVEDKNKVVPDDQLLKRSNPKDRGSFAFMKLKDTLKTSEFFFQVDSLNDYPFDAKARYSDFVQAEGQVLLVKARYKISENPIMGCGETTERISYESSTNIAGRITTCLSINDEESGEGYNYAEKRLDEFVLEPDLTATVFVENGIGTKHNKMKGRSWISAYVWNKGKNRFAITEFEIQLIDYWWWKWNFWE